MLKKSMLLLLLSVSLKIIIESSNYFKCDNRVKNCPKISTFPSFKDVLVKGKNCSSMNHIMDNIYNKLKPQRVNFTLN